MYPNLYYVFKDLFGVEIQGLRFINCFGFFVAIAFIIAAVILSKELQRKGGQGFFQPTEMQIMVGEPAKFGDLFLNFLLGFLLGYKILALFLLNKSITHDPQAFIFSSNGSWPAGIGLGLLFAGLKWWDKRKTRLPKPEKRTVRIWPHDRVGEITILALVFGLIGAKIFNSFETWDSFIKDPVGNFFSAEGLTMYGGLICAALAIWWYAKKHKISFWHLNDSAAPALMIAYAVGRIGCQVAGDGDWGIFNSAYTTTANEKPKVILAQPGDFENKLKQYPDFFIKSFDSLPNVPSANFKKPGSLGFLPNWMFAYDYPNNVNKEGVPIPGCKEEHCNYLPSPVFPTPFYETVICTLFFFVLWGVRKRLKIPGTLFGLYLILNGFERFFIEKIRVNSKMTIFGITMTQAELIATLLFISGILIWIILSRKNRMKTA